MVRIARLTLGRLTLGLLTLGLLTLGLLTGAPSTSSAQVRALEITAPHGGVVDGPVVALEAEVRDPAVRHATLVVNGAAYDVPVEQGRVSQRVVAVPGNNRVALMVESRGRTLRDSVTFRYRGPPMELVVVLGWPSEGEIIDLWVREPGGETCKWDHRETASGGGLLDFSADAIGFGSQAYAQGQVQPGAYRLKVHYWGAAARDDAPAQHDYDELIRQLDDIERQLATASTDAQRQPLARQATTLRAQLDRWAEPAAPQTLVRAEVILFPGTAHERRWRFDRLVHRTGDLLTLGEIEITEPMIRVARSGR